VTFVECPPILRLETVSDKDSLFLIHFRLHWGTENRSFISVFKLL